MKPSYFRSIRFSIRMGINKGRSDAGGTEHLGYDYLPRGSLKLPHFHPSMILKLLECPTALRRFIHLGYPNFFTDSAAQTNYTDWGIDSERLNIPRTRPNNQLDPTKDTFQKTHHTFNRSKKKYWTAKKYTIFFQNQSSQSIFQTNYSEILVFSLKTRFLNF
jgi:hypothetical protein